MKSDKVIDFLKIFFQLLEEKIISFGKSDKSVIGIVTGIKEDISNLREHQNFIYHFRNNEEDLSNMIIVCEYLKKQNLVEVDKIKISEKELVEKITELGWELDKVQKTIDNLLSVEVKMVDDGEETDSFFVHF